MKQSIKLGLAGIAAAAGLLMAAPAMADYTGNCAGLPSSVSGNVQIVDTTCVVSHAVTATGFIQISANTISVEALSATGSGAYINLASNGSIAGTTLTANGYVSTDGTGGTTFTGAIKSTGGQSVTLEDSTGSVSTGNLSTTDNGIEVLAGSAAQTGTITTTESGGAILIAAESTVTTGALSGTDGTTISISTPGSIDVSGTITTAGDTTTTNAGNVILTAGGSLETGSITSSIGGSIDLQAQKNGGTAPFIIGSTGKTNGVNGTISTTGENVSSDSPSVYVSVTNPGGITLTADTNISAPGATGYRAGTVILNAGSSTISIPAGTISLSSTAGGGQLYLLGGTVSLTGAVTLDVSQTASATANNHQINIAASTISYGTTLDLNANGDGTSTTPAMVNLVPQGAFTVTDESTDGSISISISLASQPTGALAISGADGLTVTANGNYNQANILANPISIGGTTVLIQSQGANNHGVTISNPVTTGSTGLTFSSTTSVTVDASGSATWGTTPAGGTIAIGTTRNLSTNLIHFCALV